MEAQPPLPPSADRGGGGGTHYEKGKTGNEMPSSSRSEFLGKFIANNFALLDAKDNTSGLLNRGGVADLPLLRTLLAKSPESQFSGK